MTVPPNYGIDPPPPPIPDGKSSGREYLNHLGMWRYIIFFQSLTHLFDLFEILLGLVDTASDIAVAHEFYTNTNEDQLSFFYAVFVVFLLGCFVDALSFTITLRKAGKIDNASPNFIRTVAKYTFCLVPVAPLLPLAHYIRLKFIDTNSNQANIQGDDIAYWSQEENNAGLWNFSNRDGFEFKNQHSNKSNKNDQEDENHVFDGEKFVPESEYYDKKRQLLATPFLLASEELEHHLSRKRKTQINNNKKKNDDDDEKHDTENDFAEAFTFDQETLKKLDAAVVARKAATGLILLSAVTNSLPQCCIQLISISVSKQVTPLQVFSLSLSLVSLVGKAYQLCRSFSVKHWIAKFCFVVFDVFSTALLFSSIFSTCSSRSIGTQEVKESHCQYSFIFVGKGISSLTWWWLLTKSVQTFFVLFIMIGMIIKIAANDRANRTRAILAPSLICVLAFIPVMILLEISKFSWLIIYNMFTGAKPNQFFLLTLLHGFLHGDESRKKNEVAPRYDWKATLERYKELSTISAQRTWLYSERNAPMITESTEFSDLLTWSLTFSRAPANHQHDEQQQQQQNIIPDSFLQRVRHTLLCDMFARIRLGTKVANQFQGSLNHRIFLRSLDHSCRLGTWDKGEIGDESKLKQEDFSWFNFLHYCVVPHKEKGSLMSSFDAQPTIDKVAFVITVFSCAVICLNGLLYPLLYVLSLLFSQIEWQNANSMALLCLVVTLPFLALSSLLLPEAIRVQITCNVAWCLYIGTHSDSSINEIYRRFIAHGIVDSYYSSDVNEVMLKKVIPQSEIIPSEAVERHVVPFLSGKDVSLFGMSKKVRDSI